VEHSKSFEVSGGVFQNVLWRSFLKALTDLFKLYLKLLEWLSISSRHVGSLEKPLTDLKSFDVSGGAF
jgi:hypothetical protein